MAQQNAEVENSSRRQMEEVEAIALPERKDDVSSTTVCGWKKRTLLLLGISLLIIIGGLVCGFVLLIDPLLNELMSLGAVSDEALFSDPKSPQSQALKWMKRDKIARSRDRSTQDLLQRYALAVLFFSANGPNWLWSRPYYLSSKDVCSWNQGSEDYGVQCQADGESVDELKLWDNNLKGEMPWELGLLTNLEIIDVGSNGLGGSIPSELGQLLSLEHIDIINSGMTGTIPSELGQLLALTSLAVYGNQLTGTIPTELGQLLSLENLYISSNDLTGTIPSEIGQLRSLEFLDIGSNDLTGTIPTELGQLVSLTTSLYISYNDLTGTIPTELAQLPSLELLGISDNQLTGTIPSELSGMGNLTMIYFSENALTGSLELSFCVENRTWDPLKVDCDKVECSCCACA